MFSQPNEYRGKLVKIRGDVRLGYHVPSRHTRFGIEGYNVLWVRPADGVDSPMVVYCRELPGGFPTVSERGGTGEGTRLDEEVEFTGLFFKRWLYRSRSGLNLAPLFLARVTHWQPRQAGTANAQPPATSGVVLTLGVLVIALLAGGIAWWVYRTSRWSAVDLVRSTRPSGGLPAFGQEEVEPSVRESLHRLSQREHDASSATETGRSEGADG